MKEIIVLSLVSIGGWFYFFYERRKSQRKKTDHITKFWDFGLDLKFIILIAFITIITVCYLIQYFR